MSDHEMRITQLEEVVAYQAKTIDELSDQLTAQWKVIEDTRWKLDRLIERFLTLLGGGLRLDPDQTRAAARASLLRHVQRAELVGVGLLAGFLASIVASAIGWGLARYVFDFTWTASPIVPVAGALAGAVLALGAGWWGLREVLRRPVVETLRRAAE